MADIIVEWDPNMMGCHHRQGFEIRCEQPVKGMEIHESGVLVHTLIPTVPVTCGRCGTHGLMRIANEVQFVMDEPGLVSIRRSN